MVELMAAQPPNKAKTATRDEILMTDDVVDNLGDEIIDLDAVGQFKKQLKDKHKHINIVFMQGWRSEYIVAEEDAQLIHKIDKNKEYHQISYFRTSIKRKEKKDFINELHKENKGYAFLDRIKNTNPVMRIVVDSSDKKLIGEKY